MATGITTASPINLAALETCAGNPQRAICLNAEGTSFVAVAHIVSARNPAIAILTPKKDREITFYCSGTDEQKARIKHIVEKALFGPDKPKYINPIDLQAKRRLLGEDEAVFTGSGESGASAASADSGHVSEGMQQILRTHTEKKALKEEKLSIAKGVLNAAIALERDYRENHLTLSQLKTQLVPIVNHSLGSIDIFENPQLEDNVRAATDAIRPLMLEIQRIEAMIVTQKQGLREIKEQLLDAIHPLEPCRRTTGCRETHVSIRTNDREETVFLERANAFAIKAIPNPYEEDRLLFSGDARAVEHLSDMQRSAEHQLDQVCTTLRTAHTSHSDDKDKDFIFSWDETNNTLVVSHPWKGFTTGSKPFTTTDKVFLPVDRQGNGIYCSPGSEDKIKQFLACCLTEQQPTGRDGPITTVKHMASDLLRSSFIRRA